MSIDDFKVCWNSAEGELLRGDGASYGIQLPEPYLTDSLVACLETGVGKAEDIVEDFFDEAKYASDTFIAENIRDRFIQIEYRNAIDDLVGLRDTMIEKGICAEMPNADRIPLNFISGVNSIKRYFAEYNRLPNEDYQQNILNIAERKSTWVDGVELAFLISAIFCPVIGGGKVAGGKLLSFLAKVEKVTDVLYPLSFTAMQSLAHFKYHSDPIKFGLMVLKSQ